MNIRDMPLGSVIYLDWRKLPENLPERNGRVSLVLGIPVNDGVLCVRAKGHRHEASYGHDAEFYVLTQGRFDTGGEGVVLESGADSTKWRNYLIELANRTHFGVEGLATLGAELEWGKVKEKLDALTTS